MSEPIWSIVVAGYSISTIRSSFVVLAVLQFHTVTRSRYLSSGNTLPEGANDIRAWPVRSLGPGTYKADPNAFPNQTGDVKLEGNIEYRYKMIGMLEGAFFLDVGNIWSLNDNRPGTEFRLDKFYNELAVGTGTGFRFDFSYVIFRLDVGMKLCDPSRPAGSRWIIGNRPYTTDDFNVTFAIGYPF